MVYLNWCKNMCVLQIWYVSLNLSTKTFQSKHHSTAEMQGCTVGHTPAHELAKIVSASPSWYNCEHSPTE